MPWQLRRAPLPVYAGGAGGAADKDVPAAALVHDLKCSICYLAGTIVSFSEIPLTDLSVVPYLPDVGPVLVEPHGSHQEDLTVLHEAGERAEHWI